MAVQNVAFISAAAFGFMAVAMNPAAAAPRTFVSGTGSDGNPCTTTAPCRSYQHAHDLTNPGGEIVTLDSAGYGNLVINRAITISSTGVEGSITTGSGAIGITISAGVGDTVKLRGLTLIGGGAGTAGIVVNSAKSVLIQNCSIVGYAGDGITYSAGGPGNLNIFNSEIEANGGNGITLLPAGSGAVTLYVNNSHTLGNTVGVLLDGHSSTGSVSAQLSMGAQHNQTGIRATSAVGAAPVTAQITATRVFDNSVAGVVSDGNATIYLDRTQVSANAIGLQQSNGGTFDTYKDNEVNGNTSLDTSGTITTIAEK